MFASSDASHGHVVSTSLSSDEAMISSFLTSIRQDLHLCSIVPDGRCIGRWFGDEVSDATDWAVFQSQSGRNVYWSVNRVAEGTNKKPGKADIVAARFAHVDIDPPKGGGVFDKLKTQAELATLPVPPTLIIDSGGGLQAFWRLAGPASPDDVESVNRSLAQRLGGDNCQNIDRLMRLPGTVNYPNAKKRADGRTTSLAKVIYDSENLLH
jgi:hypothetical protein